MVVHAWATMAKHQEAKGKVTREGEAEKEWSHTNDRKADMVKVEKRNNSKKKITKMQFGQFTWWRIYNVVYSVCAIEQSAHEGAIQYLWILWVEANNNRQNNNTHKTHSKHLETCSANNWKCSSEMCKTRSPHHPFRTNTHTSLQKLSNSYFDIWHFYFHPFDCCRACALCTLFPGESIQLRCFGFGSLQFVVYLFGFDVDCLYGCCWTVTMAATQLSLTEKQTNLLNKTCLRQTQAHSQTRMKL